MGFKKIKIKKKDAAPTLHTFQGGGEAHGEAPVVYGCNIDFYPAHRKRELHPKLLRRLGQASAAELLGPSSVAGCGAGGGDIREPEAPNGSSAETSDLQSAESAENNKVSQPPPMKQGPR